MCISKTSCKIFDPSDNNPADVNDIIDESSLASSVDDAPAELIEEYELSSQIVQPSSNNNNNILCTKADIEKINKRETMFKVIEEFTKCYENFDGIVQSIINDVHNKIQKFSTSHMSIINSYKNNPASVPKIKQDCNKDEFIQIVSNIYFYLTRKFIANLCSTKNQNQ